jgi:SAM-dependent methyltransferase
VKHFALLVLIACGGTPPPAPQCASPPAPVAAPAPKLAPDLDDKAVVEKSHAFFDAIDRAELPAFRDALGPTFVLYEEERFQTADDLVKSMQQRIERKAPLRTRTWTAADDRVFTHGGTAVFVGRAVEHYPADGDRKAVELEGMNTLVWVRDGERWQVAHWQWSRAGLDAERERWNEWLVKGNFNHKPNQLLVDSVKGKKPGTALDLACGQGRNVVFLATQGWKATGVDIADVGLRLTKEAAAAQKVKVETIQADVEKYDMGADKWDLVTMIYAGNSLEWVAKIKKSLKKGGLFVTEYFASDSELAKTGAGGWDLKALEAAFADGYKILHSEDVEAAADWAGGRKTKLVRFVAQKL